MNQEQEPSGQHATEPVLSLFLNPNLLVAPEQEPDTIQITVDGGAGTGKGTTCALLVQELNRLYPEKDFIHLDTGATYRCVALLAMDNQLAFDEPEPLLQELLKHKIELRTPTEEERLASQAKGQKRLVTVLLDGEDVSDAIRESDIDQPTSIIAQHDMIREELIKRQRAIAVTKNAVPEGRDMGRVVFPTAQVKIFLTASFEARAARRHKDEVAQGKTRSLEEVMADLQTRDERDLQKNLIKPPDAKEIDTTDLTPQEVVALILSEVRPFLPPLPTDKEKKL